MRFARPITLAVLALSLGGCPWMFPFGHDRNDVVAGDTAAPPDDGRPDDNGNGDTCDDRMYDCLASGREPEGCKQEYEACVGQPPPNTDPCTEAFDACILSGQAPEVCEGDYRACLGQGDGGGTPDPLAACERLFGECTALGLPDDYCTTQHDECVARYTPDPCDQLFASCLSLGLDPDYCATQHDACAAQGDTDAPAPADTDNGRP